jgi:hypothetical protein
MLMKRFYKKPEGRVKQVDENGNCTNPPPLDYVSCAHTGIEAEQNFSTRMVAGAVAEGWMKMESGKITLLVHPEPLVYSVKRAPGRYCLHCKEKLPDDNLGVFARAHMQEKHRGKKSPDASNPAGYEALNYFECVLIAKQHEKYRLRDEQKARAPHFPRKGE